MSADVASPHRPQRGHRRQYWLRLRELVLRPAPTFTIQKSGSLPIIAPTDLIYGVARMFEALSNNPNFDVQIFRSLDAAVDWLNE